jgi:single-stranded-DNA-specific exonuclease
MNWKIKHKQDRSQNQDELADFFLVSRKISKKADFLKPSSSTLKSLIKKTKINELELKKALTLINKSIKEDRPIIIYGDYDVDGICATAILWQALYPIYKKTLPFIPDRFKHGYGLNEKGLKQALKLFENQKPLIITVDNGITAAKIIKKYKQKGIDFIITDHHQIPKDKPSASALIHSDLVCGAAVSAILSQSVHSSEHVTEFSDLIALATVCDQIPLLGINRNLVIEGLKKINKKTNTGLKSLIESSGIDGSLTVYHLGFILGPRLNAAGRLKDPLIALRLLCTSNTNQASELSKQLSDLNTNRQKLTTDSIDIALKEISKLKTIPSIISIHHFSFHEGIIGLIAGKLTNKFNRPSIALSSQGEYLKASARSTEGFNIISFLRKKQDLFEELGGHPAAAGFVIKKENLAKLQKFLKTAKIKIDSDPALDIDLLLNENQNLRELNKAISFLAPFGQGWEEPVLALQNIEVISYRYVGKDQNHLQLKLKYQNQPISAISFGHQRGFDCKNVDVAFYLNENIYKGNTNLQLMIKDIKAGSSGII